MMQFFIPAGPRRFQLLDAAVLFLLFVFFYSILKLGAGMVVPFSAANQPVVDLAPSALPYYAGRSLLRMFLAFGASLLFTVVYAYLAARNSVARAILIPLLDILQSIPVLGFLSATILAFMALFPGNLFGVECASILAIFTGQAWNMTFSLYHSLMTIPRDLQEAADMLHLNWWQRLRHLELPAAAIGLIWNGMMSFGGGWFFLAASEAITVLNVDVHLPGVGSYLAAAVDAGDMTAVLYAMGTMLLMIVLVDQFFWKPLTVWGQRFKLENSADPNPPESFVFNMMQRSQLLAWGEEHILTPAGRCLDGCMDRLARRTEKAAASLRQSCRGPAWYWSSYGLLALMAFYLLYQPAQEAMQMLYTMGSSEILQVLLLGLYTFLRVLAALLLALLWTLPVGVWIGLRPRLSSRLQPLIQIMASFPANMIFPFFTVLFVRWQVDIEYGSVLFMLLGTQWYILFNVIAGASGIPNDMQEAGKIFKIEGWTRWKRIILPAVFPQLVNGLMTAAGGAWNASIVSELVSWRDTYLAASVLGAYISQATASGDWPRIVVGILVMCIFVTGINRLVWGPLCRLAETKYHLE